EKSPAQNHEISPPKNLYSLRSIKISSVGKKSLIKNFNQNREIPKRKKQKHTLSNFKQTTISNHVITSYSHQYNSTKKFSFQVYLHQKTMKEILTQTSHRPYDMPTSTWKYYQEWNQ